MFRNVDIWYNLYPFLWNIGKTTRIATYVYMRRRLKTLPSKLLCVKSLRFSFQTIPQVESTFTDLAPSWMTGVRLNIHYLYCTNLFHNWAQCLPVRTYAAPYNDRGNMNAIRHDCRDYASSSDALAQEQEAVQTFPGMQTTQEAFRSRDQVRGTYIGLKYVDACSVQQPRSRRSTNSRTHSMKYEPRQGQCIYLCPQIVGSPDALGPNKPYASACDIDREHK